MINERTLAIIGLCLIITMIVIYFIYNHLMVKWLYKDDFEIKRYIYHKLKQEGETK